MKGKSIFLSLVLGWLSMATMAHTAQNDSLGVPVVTADTVAVVATDSVAADVVADSLLAATPLAASDSLAVATDSLGVMAIADSLGLIAVPDSLAQPANLAVALDSLGLDSLGLIDAPLTDDTLGVGVVEVVKEPAKVYVFVPDSVVTLADSILPWQVTWRSSPRMYACWPTL